MVTPVASITLLTVIIAGSYFVIKKRLLCEALLGFVCIAAIACGLNGMEKLDAHEPARQLVGSVLIGICLFSLLGSAIAAKLVIFQKD